MGVFHAVAPAIPGATTPLTSTMRHLRHRDVERRLGLRARTKLAKQGLGLLSSSERRRRQGFSCQKHPKIGLKPTNFNAGAWQGTEPCLSSTVEVTGDERPPPMAHNLRPVAAPGWCVRFGPHFAPRVGRNYVKLSGPKACQGLQALFGSTLASWTLAWEVQGHGQLPFVVAFTIRQR